MLVPPEPSVEGEREGGPQPHWKGGSHRVLLFHGQVDHPAARLAQLRDALHRVGCDEADPHGAPVHA